MKNELWRLSACELAEGIRVKKFSAVEVVNSVISRIDEQNPKLNAIVADYREEALIAASEADQAILSGKNIGELHGVPVTIKTNVDVEGKPTPNGLPAFANLIAPADAPIVSNLKKAGAIIIGRTNTPELSMRFNTDNPLHGRTKNPWNEDASPGGSSGGASSAAVAGFGPIHHGNDIAGSLRCPSFCCGLSTVKPTFGRVPAWLPSASAERGILSQMISVQGAICREVRDVRLATRIMAQADPRDPFWMPVPFEDWPEMLEPVRIGVTTENYDHPIQGIKERTAMTREWSLFLEKYPLILSPYLMQPVGKWDSDTKNVEELRKFLNSGIYSLCISWLSLPAGVVPIGMVDGLPAGVQIIGRRFREDLILNAMQVIEDHTGILTKELWARENIG